MSWPGSVQPGLACRPIGLGFGPRRADTCGFQRAAHMLDRLRLAGQHEMRTAGGKSGYFGGNRAKMCFASDTRDQSGVTEADRLEPRPRLRNVGRFEEAGR